MNNNKPVAHMLEKLDASDNGSPREMRPPRIDSRQFEIPVDGHDDPGHETVEHWYDKVPQHFSEDQRTTTTLLFAGLTVAHDRFIEAALQGLGYRIKALACPDNKALNLGKEFGNRGQCNPTYYTVGNLLKYLQKLRDVEGLSTAEIIESYIFITANSCGPCRFGMYATEYRKALRDAGFEGFRVLLFQQTDGFVTTPDDKTETPVFNPKLFSRVVITGIVGKTLRCLGFQVRSLRPEKHGAIHKDKDSAKALIFTPKFFVRVIVAAAAGDVLNALGYRIRPFEIEPGATDRALEQCQQTVCDALLHNRSVLRALYRCRKRLNRIQVDRTRIKPRVSIIGEFWAMTTEGEGNYHLQRFLESEGAEVVIQPLTAWLLYLIWERRFDLKRREMLKGADAGYNGLRGINIARLRLNLWAADKALLALFSLFSRVIGLKDHHIPDMDKLAELSHRYYDNHLRGGEGHMEVGKVIYNALHNHVNMIISVKPFGCMPSSGISDGIQTLISEIYPKTLFLPIETTGDGAINAYSRIQMQLFRARQVATKETHDAYAAYGIEDGAVQAFVKRRPKMTRALYRSAHRAGSSSADFVHDVGEKLAQHSARPASTN